MFTDPLTPADQPPPRQVYDWTDVPGHNVGRSVAFCECGAQAKAGDTPGPSGWRAEHLREAWPVIVPRLPDETPGDWMARVSDELVLASQAEQELFEREGLDLGLAPGDPIPTVTVQMIKATNRVEVLQHQLDEVGAMLHRRLGNERS